MHHPVHEVNNRLAILLNQEIEPRHVAAAELQHDRRIIHLCKVAHRLMTFGSLQVLKESRVDRERSHILNNPIFVFRLRFFVDFRGNVTANRGGWPVGSDFGVRTTGIGRGSGHPATRLYRQRNPVPSWYCKACDYRLITRERFDSHPQEMLFLTQPAADLLWSFQTVKGA